jgi:hypothetical protein
LKQPLTSNVVIPSDQDFSSIDAQRGAFDRFLDTHPEIEEVVVSDSRVMSLPKYLHRYPELEAFLASHPQVKADPGAFLNPRLRYPRSDAGVFLFFLIMFVCFLMALVWVIRTLMDNRRWNRSFKLHEELHAKLIEKFASGQDFGAFLQSDAGRRLLEWTPSALDTASWGMPNPVGRILWSLQAGVVLFIVGLGILLIRGHMAGSDLAVLLLLGTLGVALGVGFIVSALVSYRLSMHLGFIGGAAPGVR